MSASSAGPLLSDAAELVLRGARDAAADQGATTVGAEQILASLIDNGTVAAPALRSCGVDAIAFRGRLLGAVRHGRARAPAAAELAYSSHARRLIEVATRRARHDGSAVEERHLLLAALDESRGPMARLLADAGVELDRMRAAVAEESTHTAGLSPGRPAPSVGHPGRSAPPPRWGPVWRLVLLGAVPLSIGLAVMHAPAAAVFASACLGVLPLAGFMGEATEHLAQKTGPTVGGLLNATFGNAAELIIAVVALRAGLIDLVKASITGSILGNLLLIVGLSIVAGGMKRSELTFNRAAAGTGAGMLAAAVVGLVFPALFHAVHPEAAARLVELHLSEWVAGILIVTYAFSLLFTLRTHKPLFNGASHPMEGPSWGRRRALLTLGLATVGVAVESEILVHATEAVTASLGLSQAFLGLIIIPIIGNAAEHAAAVTVARKGQMDLALQIAMGSSTQIALLVAPLLVFIGLFFGSAMNLVFRPFEVIALGLSTVVISILTLDGESHWFEGVQLLAVYAMVAAAAFFI